MLNETKFAITGVTSGLVGDEEAVKYLLGLLKLTELLRVATSGTFGGELDFSNLVIESKQVDPWK